MLSRIRIGKFIQPLRSTRSLHWNSNTALQDATEVTIPVPWGTIAGKWWGPQDRQPILALHGWQDNAGTFDKLVHCFPEGTSTLAIDLPGHGLSSWIPPGIAYTQLSTVLLIRRIAKYYEWHKVKLLGHSFGSMIVFSYAAHYPKEIQFAIGIDLVKPPSVEVDENCDNIVQYGEELMRREAWTAGPTTHEHQEIMHKWIKGTDYSLDEAACRILMKRGVKEIEQDQFIFTKDPRLIKYSTFDSGYIHDHILQLADRIKCPYRLIKAENSPFYQRKELVLETVDRLAKSSIDFSFTVIPGKHHVHLTHPERVSKVLNPFLEKYNK